MGEISDHPTKCDRLGLFLSLTSANSLPPVEQVEDIPRPLVVDLENWPQCLYLPLSLVRLRLCLPHLSLELLERGLDQLPSLRGRLAAGGARTREANLRHHKEQEE